MSIRRFIVVSLVAGFSVMISTKCFADTLVWSENFNGLGSFVGTGGQYQTGLTDGYGGSLSGWNSTGAGALHGIERASGDWAVMIWGGDVSASANTLTLDSGIAANADGVSYAVSFEVAPAVYAAGSQATTADDRLVVSLLNPSDTVVASYAAAPGAWANPTPWTSYSFTYKGDGSGNVRVKISDYLPGSGHFGGAIDNLSISSIPEPSAIVSLAIALLSLLGYAWRRHK